MHSQLKLITRKFNPEIDTHEIKLIELSIEDKTIIPKYTRENVQL